MKKKKMCTTFDTTLKKVAMEVKFELHHRLRKNDTKLIYIVINPGRLRVSAGIAIDPKLWDAKNQRIKGKSEIAYQTNIKLQSILAKFHHIITKYYLLNKTLTPEELIVEYNNEVMDVDFLVYFRNKLEQRKNTIAIASYKKDKSVLKKLEEFKSKILFSEFTIDDIKEYRQWCKKRGNNEITIQSNLAVIKKFVISAINDSINVLIKPTDIKVTRVKGKRIPLTADEIATIYKGWENKQYLDHEKKAVGMFLTSCFTGLRFTDLVKFKPENIINNEYFYTVTKTDKQLSLPITSLAQEIINNVDWDSIKSEQKLRDNLQYFCARLGFTRKFAFHTARHTFATNYIISGGTIEVLQGILGHSSIRETMIYLSLAQNHARREIDVYDNFMNDIINKKDL